MEKEDWETEFNAVRRYILECPVAAPEHPAVIAALQGIDQEVKRRRRDSKLHHKFSNTASHPDDMDDAVKVEVPPMDASKKPQFVAPLDDAHMNMADDWQDVVDEAADIPNDDDDDAVTGASVASELAPRVVSRLAQHPGVTCASPTGAIAVALHTVLLLGDFVCTGVPEETAVGGFAAPIRDLPVGQWLPPHWEGGPGLRYRHRTVSGRYILSVSTMPVEGGSDATTVQVTLTGHAPYTNVDPFLIVLSDHVNLESWNMAQQKSPNGTISPVLHYKALAPLLAKFMQHFHLLSKKEEADATSTTAAQSIHRPSEPLRFFGNVQDHARDPMEEARSIVLLEAMRPSAVPSKNMFSATPKGASEPWPFKGNAADDHARDPMEEARSLVLLEAMRPSAVPSKKMFSPTRPQQGAFDGDLNPLGGGLPPDFGMPSGNLMGPNHPIFTGGGGVHPMAPGMLHPRFDPFGPPGGPTEPVPPPLRRIDPPAVPPGGTGNPNNDLAIPPPFGGNDMFL